MKKGRLEAFSDGVLAIIITIMVLELKIPEGSDFKALLPVFPIFLSYVLSFIYLSIYWNNHHHLLHTFQKVSGGIMWANMHLLFWLSLVPVTTGWIGKYHDAPVPTAIYGINLFMAAVSYYILQMTIIARHGQNSLLARALGKDIKGKISIIAYLAAIPGAFINTWISFAVYALVALMWLIPDKRIEHALSEFEKAED